MRLSAVLCVGLVVGVQVMAAPATAIAQTTIHLLPADVALTGPAARHRILVQTSDGKTFGSQVRDDLVLSSSNADVVRIEDGQLVPVADGEAVITAKHGNSSATSRVTVRGMAAPTTWSFRNHVQSIIAKSGCNSGACHGALAGKGGFKLSLRGYDMARDHFTITRQSRGRRIELSDPGRSLLLAKPSGAIPHKGGVRFDVGSQEYTVIAEWLSNGAPGPSDDDPRVDRLEILPRQSVQRAGAKQQLIVQAHFSDGRVEDVTRWAKFSSTNETVAQVTDQGLVNISGHGAGAVTAWYLSKIVIANVVSPFPNKTPAEHWANAERRNFIDDLVLDQLRELQLPTSPICTDSAFIRRAFLDTIGTLPTAAETRQFLADTDTDKRDRLIDALLARPEFVDYWTYKWSDVLLVNGQRLRPQAVDAYYRWIRDAVARNLAWDDFARQIVTSTGSSFENGATNFFALHQDPQEMAENVSVAFLGLNINCARCHNHPLEKWTNDQYYSMANLFSRVRAKGWGGDARNGDGLRTLYTITSGELIQPTTGKPQPPMPLDGTPIPFDAAGDRRHHLADWLTAPDNPYFAKSISNRVWANFFHVGLVEPVDDLRVSNPPSNAKLLDAAAEYLIEQEFDLKQLMRVILQSKTYQRSAQPLPENQAEGRFYSRYYPRRMMAEVMLDAISQVTDVPTPFTQRVNRDLSRQKITDYPLGTRALQLRDSSVQSSFLKSFGRNERAIACECERSSEPSMVQVLHLANGSTINGKLQAKTNRVTALLAQKLTAAAIIDEVYFTALSRPPTEAEKSALIKILHEEADPKQQRLLIEDLFWSVMSSREFLFSH